VYEAVKVDNLTHASVAIKFSICAGTVRKIVRSFKVKDDYVQELLDRQLNTEAKFTAVANTIQDYKENKQDIWSLNQVRVSIESKHDFIVSKRLVASVLKNKFDMRFHKVKRVAFKGNSERSLVVRQ
jgi:hypothetical protein